MDAAKARAAAAVAAGQASPVRQLEMEAYSALVNALFVQGELTWRKEQLMQEARAALHVSDDAHRRELLRVHSDNSLMQMRSTSVQDSYFPKIYDEPKQVAPERVTGKRRRAAYPVPPAAAGEALQITKAVAAAAEAPPPVKKQKMASKAAPAAPKAKASASAKAKAPAKPKAKATTPVAAAEAPEAPVAVAVVEAPAAPAQVAAAPAASEASEVAVVANGSSAETAAPAEGPSVEELARLKAQIEAIKEKKMAIARQLATISETVATGDDGDNEEGEEEEDDDDGTDDDEEEEEEDDDEEMVLAEE